jgi:eukaryotic-like serine/threonine-protein kinase
MIGTKLAHYEIMSHLGTGGMGEVYQATDSKLGRSVAIKLLPEAFTHDAERSARFEREARVLASLNHPNIATIYGVEESGGRKFLVMELVAGETLAERIMRGPIPLNEALGYSRQILEALEGAHEKGIIHRDLKPANIKITSDGKIKVLDFGLAKSMETESTASTVASNSPTLSLAATQAGVILGTAAYMSPEQAKGKTVDRRTDVFAFGCILFEMLTGKRTFGGEDVSDTLGAVLIREPDWTQLPPNLPSGIRNLLRLCLEKNPKNRRGSASDVRLDLEAVLNEPVNSTQPLAKRRPHPLAVFVAALTLAIIAAVFAWNLKPKTPSSPVVRFSFALPDDQAFTNTGRQVVTWAPDGNRFVYVANNRLYLKTLGESVSRAIQGTQNDQGILNPVFSPDGQSLAFYALADKTLKRISVGGGVPVTIGSIDAPYGMSWAADDEIFAGQGRQGIVRISAKGGRAQTVITVQGSEVAHGPQLLPDGDAVLFTLAKAGAKQWDKAQIVSQSLKSGERKVLLEGGHDARYLPTGHLIFTVANTLMLAPFDVTHPAINGSALPVVEGVATSGNTGTAQFSVSSNGSLIYVPATNKASQRTLALVDRDGKATPLALPPGSYAHPRISPNGRQVAFHIFDARTEQADERADQANIWIYDLDGKTSMRQLTFIGSNEFPIWSQDGQHVLFQSDREGDLGLFMQRADGTGQAERVTKPDSEFYSHVPDSWHRDGDTFLFTKGKGSDASVWAYSLRDKKETLFADAPLWQQDSSFSPDGHWVTYMTEEKGRNVVVEPFPKTGAKFQIKDSATHPVWSPDGRELFFMSNMTNGQLFAVSIRTQPSFAFGNPVALPIEDFVQSAGSWRNYDIMPDGKHFILTLPPTNTPQATRSAEIQVVLNWLDELKQRVTVK